MQLLKALALGILICVSIPIFFLVLIFIPKGCTTPIDSRILIQRESFQQLHQMVIQLDSTKNIAVLPKDQYIVVDGLVINLSRRTFGKEPELGFYQTYYDEGNKHTYSSIDSLLSPQLDSTRLLNITTEMKNNEIADIVINDKAIYYRWKVSAMYGEEGVLYSKRKISNDSLHYKLFEQINPDFYHFAR